MSIQPVADPYRALGVQRSATDEEIKSAHRKLAKRYHPDAGAGDTVRFLRVQEAYRILSDPLLRREWDARHAPGPVRADRPARGPRPASPTTRKARSPKSSPKPPDAATGQRRPPADSAGKAGTSADSRSQPRSSHAYTWSASEVPWWEDPGSRSERRSEEGPERRAAGRRGRPTDNERRESAQAHARSEPGTPDESAFSSTQDFEVYNKSSGAAWSMAARAYFRKGDQDLPRRGSFHHQGTQILTAARARVAAEAEARRRAAAAASGSAASAQAAAEQSRAESGPVAGETRSKTTRPQPARGARSEPATSAAAGPQPAAAAYGAAAARPASNRAASNRAASTRQATPAASPEARTGSWPSLGQRLVYGLIAWLPMVGLLTLGTAGLSDEITRAVLMALTLGLLVAVPRLAYLAAVATLVLLVIAAVLVGGLIVAGVDFPLGTGVMAAIGAGLLFGYLATIGLVALGPASLRPWSTR